MSGSKLDGACIVAEEALLFVDISYPKDTKDEEILALKASIKDVSEKMVLLRARLKKEKDEAIAMALSCMKEDERPASPCGCGCVEEAVKAEEKAIRNEVKNQIMNDVGFSH